MSVNSLTRMYRKKHFYCVTWTRSEKLLDETPWLKSAQRDYCIVGYRQPTPVEAQEFIGQIMYDRLFDKVASVREISREEALRDFQMENWRGQKVFGADERTGRKARLSDQINSATSRAAELNPAVDDPICKVTFCRTGGIADLHQFDIELKMMPVNYKAEGELFLLETEERIKAYDKAAEKIGEDALSDYSILSARMIAAGRGVVGSIDKEEER